MLIEGRIDNRPALAAQARQPVTAPAARCSPRCGAGMARRCSTSSSASSPGSSSSARRGRVHALPRPMRGTPAARLEARAASGLSPRSGVRWRLPGPPRPVPNPEWFVSGFLGQSIEPRATPYVGVDMVLPGYVASAGRDGWTQARRADWHIPKLRDTRRGAYAEEFRGAVRRGGAVSCRGAGSTLGICLSGGLDSTSVIASAKAVLPDQRRVAVCMAMVEPVGDERVIQRMMAEQVCGRAALGRSRRRSVRSGRTVREGCSTASVRRRSP